MILLMDKIPTVDGHPLEDLSWAERDLGPVLYL